MTPFPSKSDVTPKSSVFRGRCSSNARPIESIRAMVVRRRVDVERDAAAQIESGALRLAETMHDDVETLGNRASSAPTRAIRPRSRLPLPRAEPAPEGSAADRRRTPPPRLPASIPDAAPDTRLPSDPGRSRRGSGRRRIRARSGSAGSRRSWGRRAARGSRPARDRLRRPGPRRDRRAGTSRDRRPSGTRSA